MPREPRSFEPGVVYHLISRIVERKFLISATNRGTYLELTRKALKESDWDPLGYAIMSNHIHHGVVAGRQPLDAWLRPIHSPFADILNKQHDRIGPVFVRGPKAFPVPNARVGHLLSYIHNNPVRAGLCATASESKWTSHRAYMNPAQAPAWLNVSRGLALCALAPQEFDEWTNEPAQLADTSFSEAAHERELLADKEAEVLAARDDNAFAIVEATARVAGIPTSQMLGASRGSAEVIARAAAVHCSSLLGLPVERIAGALNLSKQRVSVLRRHEPANDAVRISARVFEMLGGAK